MATCRLAVAAVPVTTSVAKANSPGSNKSRIVTKTVVRTRNGSCNSFSHSELFAKSDLSSAVAASVHSHISPVVAQPLTPICKVKEGDKLPAAKLKDQDGKVVDISKFKGKPLVLYFYPADETPGCTKQACAFRDSYEKFKKAGAEVVGVSGDTPESHRAFKQKYRLPFTLLSDDGNKLRKDWGVPSDFFGTLAGRQTYVFDKSGTVQLIYNNQFQPEKHIDETLKVLKS
jgi:peroxiredoxin Q/BCP